MSARPASSHLKPWLGLIFGALGWAGSHQVSSTTLFDDCSVGSPALILFIGAIGLVLAVIGGLASWTVGRDGEETAGRRFVGLIGALLAALTSFAIVLHSLSILIIPPCAG
jgi:hypothetical protein